MKKKPTDDDIVFTLENDDGEDAAALQCLGRARVHQRPSHPPSTGRSTPVT